MFIQTTTLSTSQTFNYCCFCTEINCKVKPRVKPDFRMKATVNILCYKSKKLSNGEHPLMIRICKDGNKKYISLGVSVRAEHWDFKKNKPKRNCPNKQLIENLIISKTKEYTEHIIELTVEKKQFSPSSIAAKVQQPLKAKTVLTLFQEYINRLQKEKRLGYSLSIKQTYNSLKEFTNDTDLFFTDIDTGWLGCYESWLREKNLSDNTIGIRFRNLRVLYNLAVEEKIIKAENYPFKSFKVSKLHQATAKRSISKDELMKIVNYEIPSNKKYKRLAADLFVFSYLMGGINFMDIAYLTSDNIIDNRLVYCRKKTNKLIKLPLQAKAIEIINRYKKENQKYIFPILYNTHMTEQQQRYRIHDVIANVNKHLIQIGKDLEIPIKLTTYVARHSYATVLKRSGVATSIISESLGHSSEKVTQIYLDSFENSQIDEAMKNLL